MKELSLSDFDPCVGILVSRLRAVLRLRSIEVLF